MAELNAAVLKALLEMLEDYHAHSNPLLDLLPLKVSAIALAQDPELARRFRAVLALHSLAGWRTERGPRHPYWESPTQPGVCGAMLLPPGHIDMPVHCGAPEADPIHVLRS